MQLPENPKVRECAAAADRGQCATMLPSGAAHAACLALAVLPSTPPSQAIPQPSASCAFCGGWTASAWLCRGQGIPGAGGRRTRGSTSAAAAACSPLLRTADGCGPALWGNDDIFVAAAGRWDDDAGADDGEGGGARRQRKSRTAPWEDIQWSNVPADRKARAGGRRSRGRGRSQDEDEVDEAEEEEEEYIEQEERRRGRARSGSYFGEQPKGGFKEEDAKDGEDDTYESEAARMRRRPARPPARRAAERGSPEKASSPWDSGWFKDAQQANQGGLFEWARRSVGV